MSSLKPINHGFDHRRGGTDPVFFQDYPIWTRQFRGELTDEEAWAPFGTIAIDTTRLNNYRVVHSAGTTDSWGFGGPLPLGPGGYTLFMNSQAGPSYGSLDVYVAGAYAFSPDMEFAVGPSDWIYIASFDFSRNPSGGAPYTVPLTYIPFSRTPDKYGYFTGGYTGNPGVAGWAVDIGATDYGLANIYKLSTAIDTSGNLNGGAGYYFIRLDVTGTFELSELLLLADR